MSEENIAKPKSTTKKHLLFSENHELIIESPSSVPPHEMNHNTGNNLLPRTEPENPRVGDNRDKKPVVNILCECHNPNEKGAAVPTILSITDTNLSDNPSEVEDFYDALEDTSDKLSSQERLSGIRKSPGKPSLIPKPRKGKQGNSSSESGSVKTPRRSRPTSPTENKRLPENTSRYMFASSEARSSVKKKLDISRARTSAEISLKSEYGSILLMKLFKEISDVKSKTDAVCKSEKHVTVSNFAGQAKDVEKLFNAISVMKKTADKLCNLEGSLDFSTLKQNNAAASIVDSSSTYSKSCCKHYENVLKKCGKICQNIDEICTTLSNIKRLIQNSKKARKQFLKAISNSDKFPSTPQEFPAYKEEDLTPDEVSDKFATSPQVDAPDEPKTQKVIEPGDEEQVNFVPASNISTISVESFRKLRRCPKDFSLQMEILQNQRLFQTGEGNLSISQNFHGDVTEKKSDIIKIKSSTECCYISQIIPVVSSPTKPLKAANREIFNVVNIFVPYWSRSNHMMNFNNKNNSILNCITISRSLPLVTNRRKVQDHEDLIEDMYNAGLKQQASTNRRRFRSNSLRFLKR